MPANFALPLWVAATLLIGYATLQVAYHSGAGRIQHLVQTNPVWHVLAELAAFVFHIGLPFLALISGVIGLDLIALGMPHVDAVLGFAPIDWVRSTGIATGTALFVLAVLWLAGRRQPLANCFTRWESGFALFRIVLFDEVHWVFYRSVGTLLFQDAYWGAVLGFGLIGLEWALHPNFVAAAKSPETRQWLLLRLVCLLVSSALYLGVQNLWLMLLAHWAIRHFGARIFSAKLALTLNQHAEW
jgi:hypothetical protein